MESNFWSTWLLSALFSSLFLIYWYLTRNFNHWTRLGIKGPKPVIGFGTLLQRFLKQKSILEVEMIKRFGKIYGQFIGSEPVLIVAEPEIIKQILVKDFNIFTDKISKHFRHPILSKNLAAVNGKDWQRIRSIVSPSFTSCKMKKMYPVIKECLNKFLDVLDIYAKDGKEVNMKAMYGNYTMDVIATCAFATKCNPHNNPGSKFISNAIKTFSPGFGRLFAVMMCPRLLLNMIGLTHPVPENVNEFFFNITRKIIKDRKTSNETHNDFIQLLLNANKNCNKDKNPDENDQIDAYYLYQGAEEKALGKNILNGINKFITEDEMLAQAWIFFSAGYETTATTLSFATYELALQPLIQNRLHREVMSAVDINGDIDYDLLAKLPFLDAVLSETLRLHPPTTRLGRFASTDYTLAKTGITIKKGQRVEIPVYALHHMEEYYPDPMLFNPDRFSPENRHNIQPYTYLPFGAGPRHCIGMRFALMEAKLCLAQLVKKYTFTQSANTDIPVLLSKQFILHSPTSVFVAIKHRE